MKQGGVFPDFPERGLFHVAGDAGKVGTGLDVAEAVDEADGLGRDAPLAAAGGEGEGAPLEFHPLRRGPLGRYPVVVGGAGGTHQDLVLVLLLLIVPLQDLFVVLLGDQLLHESLRRGRWGRS